MKKISIPLCILVAAALSACGSDFELFPDYVDTSPPTISATVAGKSFSNNSTVHVTNLPASVIFTSSEAATIYYTTNGNSPTSTSNSINLTAAGSSTVSALITATNTVLKFFGIDNAGNESNTISGTVVSP
jgi:hypothetical protein